MFLIFGAEGALYENNSRINEIVICTSKCCSTFNAHLQFAANIWKYIEWLPIYIHYLMIPLIFILIILENDFLFHQSRQIMVESHLIIMDLIFGIYCQMKLEILRLNEFKITYLSHLKNLE